MSAQMVESCIAGNTVEPCGNPGIAHEWVKVRPGFDKGVLKYIIGVVMGEYHVTYLPVGIHEVEVLLDLDETVYEYQPVKVTVYITEETGTEETPVDSDSSEIE